MTLPDVSREPRPIDAFDEVLAAYDRIIEDKALQQELLDAGLLVRVDPAPEAALPPDRDEGLPTATELSDAERAELAERIAWKRAGYRFPSDRDEGLAATLDSQVSTEGAGLRGFVLRREADVSGVSGTGDVAEGVVFSDGTTVLRWNRAGGSTAVYDSLERMEAIHGHDGRTAVVFLAATQSPAAPLRDRIEPIIRRWENGLGGDVALGYIRAALTEADEARGLDLRPEWAAAINAHMEDFYREPESFESYEAIAANIVRHLAAHNADNREADRG